MPRLTKSEISKNELRDIVISVLVVTLIISYHFSRPTLGTIFGIFPFILIIVILSFLAHELAHRYAARKFGCFAVYKMWLGGVLIGLLSMLLGFPFIIMGAVVIYPFKFGRWGFRKVHLTMTETGIISVAGICVNLLFAALFSPLAGTFVTSGLDFFGILSFFNAWWALLNLIPIPPLDGRKVFGWKPWLWFLLILIAVLLVYPYFIS